MCMVVFDGRFGKTFCGLSDHKFVKCPFHGQRRTGDLLITSELLCQLSHTSINADGSIAYFAGAVNRFSGEESLFLLRLLPKWVRTGNDNT